MGIVADIMESLVLPILKTTVILAFFLFLCWTFVYMGMQIFNPMRRLWIKHKIFRKKYDEEDVEWVMGAIEKEISEEGVRKFLLLNQVPEDKINRLVFIYRELNKMKGGKNKHDESRRGSRKTQIPKP